MVPTLETDRLNLVPLSDEHIPFRTELDADPEVMRFLLGRGRTPDEVIESQKKFVAYHQSPGMGFWIGFTGDKPVGMWLLIPPERPDQTGDGELGYRVLRRHWGQKYATEGNRAILEYAFKSLGLNKIFIETMFVNAASRATAAKLGMQYQRTFHLKFEHPLENKELGEVEYAITREEWAARKGAEAT